MNHRPSPKCAIELLEDRLLMAAQPSSLAYSTNWSGYAVAETANDSVGAVSGAWTVPAVSGKTSGYSADWVGIDGYSSNSVEQLGTEEDTAYTSKRDGTPQYYAWIEMYPAASWIIPGTVKPGDAISASVQFLGSSNTQYTAQGNTRTGMYTGNKVTTTSTLNDNFQLSITDSTQKWTFSIPQSMAYQTDQRNSAEWIVEAPSGGSVLPLANFGLVTFTSATATINSVTGSIGSNPPAALDKNGNPTASGWVAMDMIGKHNQQLDATSVLNPAGNSFAVNFGSQTPTAPNTATAGSNLFSNTLLSSSPWSDGSAKNPWS